MMWTWGVRSEGAEVGRSFRPLFHDCHVRDNVLRACIVSYVLCVVEAVMLTMSSVAINYPRRVLWYYCNASVL